jgi:hypothetical protein
MAAIRALEAARLALYATADRVIDTEALDLQEVVESVIQMTSAER